MREKFRQFMIGRYGTDGLNQFLSIASIVLLLISLLTRFSLFTWLVLVLLVLCYYRSLSRNISKRTEALGLQNNRSRDFPAPDSGDQLVEVGYLPDVGKLVQKAPHMDGQPAAVHVIRLITKEVE